MTWQPFTMGVILSLCGAVSCSVLSVTEPATVSDGSGGAGGDAGTTGGGGMAGSTSAAGGAGACQAMFDYPGMFGGMQCQKCAQESACTELLACDQADCASLISCFQACDVMQNAPCIISCSMQNQASDMAFAALNQLLATQCFAPCGYTSEFLCNTMIPAWTSNCKTAVEKDCCTVVTACSDKPECRDCATGMATGSCDGEPLFDAFVACLNGLQGTCSF
jgi:hypothetical protein